MGGHWTPPPFRPERPATSGVLSFEAAWRVGLKTPEEVMEILEAFDATGSLRAAAELARCDHETVGHWVQARDEAGGGVAGWGRGRGRGGGVGGEIGGGGEGSGGGGGAG